MSTPVLIYVTANTEENATLIANALIKDKLASAVQISPIKSVYWWEEEIVKREEFVLTIKTLSTRYQSVKDTVYGLHTYEVPVMEMIGISKIEPSHLKWLQDSLA